jgi:hypothetical protein
MIRPPAATGTSTTLAGFVALAIFPAFGCSAGPPTAPPTGSHICGATSSPSMPRALIGPDVDVHTFCAGTAQAPIASVDELGAGVTRWSITVKGAAAFTPDPKGSAFVTCEATGPQVAFAQFSPPRDALPGAIFDAIATVHADDGSFADGTVKLHGEVVAPVVTVDKTTVDFGNVGPGDKVTIPLHFTEDNGATTVRPDSKPDAGTTRVFPSYAYGPFVITLGGVRPSIWNVTFMTDVPGDYSATVGWRAGPPGAPCQGAGDASCLATPSPCDWTTTITLHARVVVDGGADADTADASDGGADLAPDAP